MYDQLRPVIARRIDALPRGARFNLPELLGAEWPANAGIARQLGRDFRANLHTFPDVEDVGKDNENLRWYQKR